MVSTKMDDPTKINSFEKKRVAPTRQNGFYQKEWLFLQ